MVFAGRVLSENKLILPEFPPNVKGKITNLWGIVLQKSSPQQADHTPKCPVFLLHPNGFCQKPVSTLTAKRKTAAVGRLFWNVIQLYRVG